MKNFIFAIIFLMLFSGCATYYTTSESLTSQLDAANKEGIFKTSLRKIKCVDKNGNDCELVANRNTTVWIIKNDGTSEIMYWKGILYKDSTIYGFTSIFRGLFVKPIKLSDIKKIEIHKY